MTGFLLQIIGFERKEISMCMWVLILSIPADLSRGGERGGGEMRRMRPRPRVGVCGVEFTHVLERTAWICCSITWYSHPIHSIFMLVHGVPIHKLSRSHHSHIMHTSLHSFPIESSCQPASPRTLYVLQAILLFFLLTGNILLLLHAHRKFWAIPTLCYSFTPSIQGIEPFRIFTIHMVWPVELILVLGIVVLTVCS